MIKPIFNNDAEAAVLGCIILEPDRVLPICHEKSVGDEHFYNPNYREIFQCAIRMEQEARPIDILTITDRLRSDGLIERAGGPASVENCVDVVPSSAHAEYWIDILCDTYKKRQASYIAQEAIAGCVNNKDNAREIIAETIQNLVELNEERKTREIEQIIKGSVDKWTAARSGKTSGIPSPWRNFNERFGGLQNGAVTLFAGKAGEGKSSAAACWAYFLGSINCPTGYFPFEDGAERTWQRIAGIHGDFSVFKLDVGEATEDEVYRAGRAMEIVSKYPIFIEDRHMTASQICSWATSQKAKNKIRVLFIDAFKDIIRSERNTESDDNQSQVICSLARRLDIPVLVFHHVRKPDGDNSWLTGADIRGSGQIYSDARQVILLQSQVSADGSKEHWFEIEKNNYGPTGKFPMTRISNRCKWIERIIKTDAAGRVVKA